MKKLLSLTIAFGLCVMNVFAQSKMTKTFDGVKKINMNTSSGDCKLVKGNGNRVTVDLEHTFGESLTPEFNQEGERLNIREIFASGTSRGTSRWTISVPDGVEVKFSTGSGSIDATELNLNLDIRTGSGDIRLSNVKGDVRGNTGSGEIDLDNFSGEIKANTGSGNITVAQSSGEIDVNCGSGDIHVRNSKASFSVNTGSGTIRSQNITLEGSSRFNTGSGDAEVVLAASPKYNISVNSGSGNAELDFNGNAIVGEVVMKANKRNGTIKAPFEFDKTEEIAQGGDQVTVKKTAVKGNADIKIAVGTGSGAAVLK